MKALSLFLLASLSISFTHAQDLIQVGNNASIHVGKTANMYVEGGILLENNSAMHNDGDIVIVKNNTNKAYFIDNTTTAYNYGSGRFTFSGTGMQSIKANNQFGVIEVDNKGLNLLSDVSSNKWNLKNGIVNTGAYHTVAAASQSDWFSADGGNERFSNSWINGNLRQYISPEKMDQYVLPVGDARSVKLCEIDNLTRNPLTGVQYVDVSFARPFGWNDNLKATENGMQYSSVNSAGMWNIVPDAKPASGSFDLKVSIANFSGLADNKFALLNRSGAAGVQNWAVPAGSRLPADGSFGRTVASGFARRNNVTQFNQFAVASMDVVPTDLAASYKVYPDPVTDNEFFIQVKNYDLKSFKLFAADGKEVNVNSTLQKSGQVKVSLPSSFAKGSYIVQLNTDKGLKTAKIIVQ